MSGTSPESILYDISGNVLAVQNATAIPSSTPGLLFMGSDGTNSRYITVDSSGRLVSVGAGVAGTPAGGVFSVQGVAGGTNLPVTVSGTATVSGTVTANQGTANTIANSWPVEMTDGTNILGTAAHPVRTDPTGTTIQPISGTVTANAGSGNFAVVQATASNLLASVGGLGASGAATVGNPVRIGGSDGTNTRDILTDSSGRQIIIGAAANGAAVTGNPVLIAGSDGTNARSIRTANDGTVRVDPTGTTTQPVSGTVAATQSGTWTVQPGNTANTTPWLITINQGGNSATVTASNALKVDGSAVTQPVSGTVTANIGTTGGLALETTQVKLTIAQSTALGSNTQVLVGGSVTTAAPTYTTGNINPFSLTTTGSLRVDGSGSTQPVSGTITANQGGTWTVQPGNTANTTPWLVTDSSDGPVTPGAVAGKSSLMGGQFNTVLPTLTNTQQSAIQLDSSGRILIGSIPTGANVIGAVTQSGSWTVTANAGTGNFSVIGTGTDNTTNSTTKLPVLAARANTSAPTWTDGNMVPLSVDTSGSLRITGSISATNPSVSTTGTTPPASATYIGGSVTTAAPTYTTGQMNALSLTTTGLLRVDGSGVTQPVSGTVTANAGTGNFTVVQATAANLRAQTASEFTTAAATGTIATLTGGAVTTAAPTYTTGQMNPLSLTTTGALRIDGSGTTQPISGTVAATQSGTWNITNISGTITLPTGAATETTLAAMSAKLPAALVGGRLDTNIGAWLGSTAPTVGSKTSANSIPIVIASDQGAVTVNASATVGIVDNAAFTDGTTRIQPAGYIFDEVAGTALTENDGGAARIDSKRAQIQVIEDGTTRGTRVAVKAASTAAVAGDPAMVVAISPNNTVTIGAVTVSQSDTTATGSLNSLNAAVSVALAGTAGAAMQLVAGTLVGTIVPEISVDGGTTWTSGQFFDPITGVLATSIVFGVSNTAQTKTIIITGGTSHVRVRVSAFTSGTATCNLRATTANDPSTAIRGTDGSVLRTVLLDTSGRIVIAPAGTSATTSGFTNGDILLTNTGNVPVRRTTLTEQSSNAQRSVVSASANDTSAGTGARTVKITYYDSSGAGPSTETITMNGTSAVNTVSTTICYVEKLEVITVGSTGSNVGAITLKAATAGAGATIMTMSATDNQTYLSVHYVPTGKTCYITGINVGSTSSGIAQGGLYTVRAQSLSGTNNPDKQISDFLYLFGQSSGLTRTYDTPIQIVGPARLQLWVNPFSNNTVTFGGGFDFYEQ